MPDRNHTRSQSYQPFFTELSMEPNILGELSIAQGLFSVIESDVLKEDLLDLKDKLAKRMWEIIEVGLTKRQKQVVYLYNDGLTQNEIAKKLGINQTSVHKVLKGNIDNKNDKRRYGGAFKKINKLCKTDEKIIEILKEIQEICECIEL